MTTRTIDLTSAFSAIGRDSKAQLVGSLWDKWNQQRKPFIDEVMELRSYLYATDTSTTSNSSLPHNNSTTIPHLTRIYDTLLSNYITGLLPNDKWLQWVSFSKDEQAKLKRQVIQAYMSNKTREGGVREVLLQLLSDFITWGMAFTDTEYVNESKRDPETGLTIPGYVGPKLVRINPSDIVFDLTGTSFKTVPKIVRKVYKIGDLKGRLQEMYDEEHLRLAISRREAIRNLSMTYSTDDITKATSFRVDGFGSLSEYYLSDYVEILELTGDLYDSLTDTLYKSHVVTVMDRSTVLRDEPLPTWKRHGTIEAVAWRDRPDNLWGMSPLANLIGMQYRIDHLENLKADMFDLMANPPIKVIGDVEDFEFGPFERINILDNNSDVQMFVPDMQILNADTQIDRLEVKMEEIAGAPRTAMGIRTPGEKTKFEVQTLDNAASRTFQEKITKFEIALLEPSLNNMLEVSRRNMNGSDQVRVMDDEIGIFVFKEITKEDLTAIGKLRPIGARHFSQQANVLQDLTALSNTRIWDKIQPHISARQLADLVENLMSIEQFDVIDTNIAVIEEAEMQQLVNDTQQSLDEEIMEDPFGEL